MSLYPKGKGVAIVATAGTPGLLKTGPTTLLNVSFIGGAGATVAIYDGNAAVGSPVAIFRSDNTTIAATFNPWLHLEFGCFVVIAGTFAASSFVSLTLE